MTSNDEWTHVQGRRSHKNRSRPDDPHPSHPTPDRPHWPPVIRDLTLEHLKTDFAAKQRIWRASACRAQVHDIIQRLRPAPVDESGNDDDDNGNDDDDDDDDSNPDDLDHATGAGSDHPPPILDAFCLGSGSPSRDNFETRRRSLFQLAVFVDVVEFLERVGGDRARCKGFPRGMRGREGEGRGRGKIRMHAQDPAYTPLDVAFLRGMGFEVHGEAAGKTGRAMDRFDRNSFVCELFMERQPEFLESLLRAEVALVVGSMLTDRVEIARRRGVRNGMMGRGDEAVLARIAHFHDLEEQYSTQYRPFRVPRFDEDPNTLEGLHIAARHVKNDDEDECD